MTTRLSAERWIWRLVGLVLSCLIMCSAWAGTNRYVSLDGGNISPYTNWAMAGASLKAVVDYANACADGDTVWISNGTYNLTAAVVVQNTVIKSFNTNRDETIVNGGGAYRCLSLQHVNAWVEGLTLSNGYVNPGSGGGAEISGGTLTNCVVRDCVAVYAGSYGGGGIAFTYNGAGLVTDCVIMSNRNDGTLAGGGGGVYINGANCVLRRCRITGNTGNTGGGVCQRYTSAGALIDDCDICFNVATNTATGGNAGGGGGICTPVSAMVVTNCRIYGNSAVECGGGVYVSPFNNQITPKFVDCQISNNVVSCTVPNVFLNTYYGGGGGVFAGGGVFVGCEISGNVSSNTGGGINAYRWATVMSNCIVRGNTANVGGGVYIIYNYASGGLIDMYNCLIAGNVATNTGGGVGLNPWSSGYNNPITFWNCTIVSNSALGANSVGGILKYNIPAFTNYFKNTIVYLNSGASYSNWGPAAYSQCLCFSNSCTAPTNGTYFIGSGNTALSPLFVNVSAGDFRLRRGSPCVNSGLNDPGWMSGATDLDGRDRIREAIVDMGAYELIPISTIISTR